MKKSLIAVMFGVLILTGCGKSVDTTEVVEEVATEVEAQDDAVNDADDDVAEKPVVDEEPAAEEEESASPYSYTDLSQTLYAQSTVNVRDLPEQTGAKLGSLSTNQEVTVIGQCNETGWYKISYNGGEGFVSNSYLGSEKVAVKSKSSSQTESQSQAAAEAPAEAPAAEPEVQPGQLDGNSLVTEEGQLGYGETLAPDHHVCPVCGFETDDANEYVTHLREVHNMQV